MSTFYKDVNVYNFHRLSSNKFDINVRLIWTNVTSALEVFKNVMRYINPRFTYLLTM